MKYFGLGLVMAAVVVAPAFAQDMVNQEEFKKAASAAGDMGFNISLAQTARLLDYCGQKPKAQEVRDYLQPVTMAVTREKFKNDTASVRGMFLSRNIAASMATEMATIEVLDKVEPLSDAQTKKLCDEADESYGKIMELKAKAQAGAGVKK